MRHYRPKAKDTTHKTCFRPRRAAAWALILGLLCTASCREAADSPAPLLVIAGPNDLMSFEVRDSEGTAIWRFESESNLPLDFIVYAQVPRGFRQTLPERGRPRLLDPGEDLELESRNARRKFVHVGYADSPTTMIILDSAMARLPSESTR